MNITRVKRPERDFAIIKNDVLRDERLSFRARGVLVYMLSYPEGYTIDAAHLVRSGPGERDAICSALKELEKVGYLVTSGETL